MKLLNRITFLFLVCGVAMLGGAGYFYLDTKSFATRAVRVQGEVVDLILRTSSDGSTYAPVVRFKALDGSEREFTSSASSNPPGFSKGESVEVLYNPEEQSEARINTFFQLWGFPLGLFSMGLLFSLFSLVFFVRRMFRSRMIEKLKSSGHVVIADFQQVAENTSLKVNGRHPFRIVVQWKDPATSDVQTFYSDDLWFNPSNYIDRKQLKVYVDQVNAKNYFVDTSFLPRASE